MKTWLCTSLLIFVSMKGMAGELKISVNAKDRKSLDSVVVTLEPIGSDQAVDLEVLDVNINQMNREFVPAVTVVTVGSSVSFPNQDDILHHVYSFSKVKTFDLPLYKDIPNDPIKFDAAGVATLGCNIHDWMSAHVVVVDTPYYQQANKLGVVELANIPSGEYELLLWHPRQKKPYKEAIVIDDNLLEKTIELKLKPSFRSRRQHSNSTRNY